MSVVHSAMVPEIDGRQLDKLSEQVFGGLSFDIAIVDSKREYTKRKPSVVR